MIPFSIPIYFSAHSQSWVLKLCLDWYQFESKSGITFLAGGTTAPGSLPPASIHSGPCALISQTKFPKSGSVPIIPLWEVSSTKLSPLTFPSFISTNQLPWSHCCCCCWVASVVSDSVLPHRWQATRLPCPWDSPGKNTGVGCHFLLQCVKVKSLSHVWLLATPWTAAYQVPPSTGFPRRDYWSRLPLPSPPWSHYVVAIVECENVFYTPGSSFL